MADLSEINARWARTDHPHAVYEGEDTYFAYCPQCQTSAEESQKTLLGAMNDAIVHKNHCAALRS